METNKLLTLEEINGYQSTPAYTSPTTKRLLATARAYWELKNTSKDIVDIDQSSVFGLPEDKPHLPTLKVIVEAMKEMLNQYHFANSSIDCGDLATFTESLEKHLE